jgi:hypothetical protein
MAINLFTSGGSIKSVQRGVTTGYSGGSTDAGKDITISAVNPAKCIVQFDGFPLDGAGVTNTATQRPPYVTSLTSTTLSIKGGNYTQSGSSTLQARSFSWTVTEFE